MNDSKQTYPFSDTPLTVQMLLDFFDGRDGSAVEWDQVTGLTADELRDARDQGMRPFLFADGVHMIGAIEEHTS